MRIHNNLLFTVFLGLLHFIQAYIPRSRRLQGELQSNKTVTMTLTNQQNSGYYATILVGDLVEVQFFSMMVDIGTPWIFIPDSTCTNCLYSDINSPYYDCSDNSDTCYQDTRVIQQLSYPNGTINGYPGSEIVNFVGLPLNVSVNSSINFATSIFTAFYNTQANGIMGFGLDPTLNNTNEFLNNLYNQGLITNKMFSIFITDDFFAIDTESIIIFGSYDPQYIDDNAEFMYVPVQTGDGWAIGLEGLSFGNASIPIAPTSATLSTLFPDIGVPEGTINSILALLNNMGFDCMYVGAYVNPLCRGEVEDIDNFPPLTIQVSGMNITLDASGYTAFAMTNTAYYNVPDSAYSIVLQFREIQIQNFNENLQGKWILGSAFLRNFYVICDQDNQMIGLAPSNPSVFYWSRSDAWVPLMIIFTVVFLVVSGLIIGRGIYKRTKVLPVYREENEDLMHNDDLAYNNTL